MTTISIETRAQLCSGSIAQSVALIALLPRLPSTAIGMHNCIHRKPLRHSRREIPRELLAKCWVPGASDVYTDALGWGAADLAAQRGLRAPVWRRRAVLHLRRHLGPGVGDWAPEDGAPRVCKTSSEHATELCRGHVRPPGLLCMAHTFSYCASVGTSRARRCRCWQRMGNG